MELVVRDGKFFTIGDNGAEFFHYKKNDIVFNAAQTESLFKYGGIKGANPRGKMLASGSAFAEGKAFGGSSGTGGGMWDDNTGTNDNKKVTVEADKVTVVDKSSSSSTSSNKNTSTGKTYSKSSSDSKSKDSEKDSAEEFEETIDWIETAIERIERSIDRLDIKANSTYRSWGERNEALADQISKVGDEIDLQQKAYDEYMKAANDVGLSEEYAKKVRDGTLDIETITDEGLKEKIDDYQQWYEKALDCEDAILDLKETEGELYRQRFDNVQSQYDAILQGYEHTEAMLDEYISKAEAKGQIVSKNYYQALINNEKANIAELKKEQADLIKTRDEAVASGKIKKYSEEWYDMSAEIDGVTESIEEGETAIIEYGNSIRDIDWEVFDKIQERISRVNEEAEFFIELMSNEKLFDDNGKLTEHGAATMGLHAQNYNTHMYQADEYGKEVADLDKQIAKDLYNQDLINRRDELIDLQRESILAAEDEKEAIRDLVEEGINLELEALDERIEKRKEELDSQKDLYDFQKKVKEQTEEIADIQKQISAYENDDSEEAKAKVQELRVSLEEAQDELSETEYDKFISDSEILLDSLYLEYETILNARLDDVDALLSEVIAGVNATTVALSGEGAIAQAIVGAMGENGSIKNILNTEADNVGITLSDAMNNIWSVGEGNAKSVLTLYGEGFQNKLTTTNTTLNSIKTSINSMVSSLNKEAQTKVNANKTDTSANKNPIQKGSKVGSISSGNKTLNKKTKVDGKPKIGEKVKFVSGQYYYDAQGKEPLGDKNKGKYVYITNINNSSWATHPYHISTGSKLGKGDLGWLKLNQLSGYATGKKDFFNNEIAWTQENGKEFIVRPSDGAILTPVAKGDSILNANASRNIWDMANNPADFIRENLNLDAANMPNNLNVHNNIEQNFENINFNMPNVRNYNELVSEMQRDPKFEKLILAMTVDQIAGKSSLAKGKSIR